MAETVAPAAPVTEAPAAPAAPSAAQGLVVDKPWFDGFESPELKEWLPKVGLKTPEAVAMKAYNLEKFVGADKAGRGMVLPRDEKDTKGWDQVYTRLGRPEKPDGYKLPIPEGDNGEFAKIVAPVLHAAGLNQTQAEKLATWWNQHQETTETQQFEAGEKRVATELESLKKDWGGEYDTRVEVARRVSREAGLTEDEGVGLVHALGARRALEIMHFFGKSFSENKVAGLSQQGQGFGMNKAEAQDKISELKRDQAWTQRYLAGGSGEKAELSKLLEIVNA